MAEARQSLTETLKQNNHYDKTGFAKRRTLVRTSRTYDPHLEHGFKENPQEEYLRARSMSSGASEAGRVVRGLTEVGGLGWELIDVPI